MIKCKECGEYFSQTPHKHLMGHGCPHCKKSHGEERIKEWLKIHNFIKDEDYIPQFRDKWLGLQSLDFYLPKLNIGIEYDGAQHFKPIKKWGGEEVFKKTQERDKRKDLLCEENRVNLLRISYTDYDNIESILEGNIVYNS